MTTTPAPLSRFNSLGRGVDVALLGVTAAVAVSLVRAFRTWDQLWPLLLIVVVAHGLSWLGRALHIGALAASVILPLLGVVVITLVYYRSQSWYGVPGPTVFSHAANDIRVAFGPFQKLVAPVDALPGFTVAFAAGLWLIAVFADLAAGRADAPLQAVIPHAATFTFSSVLLLGRHALTATAVFATALVLYRLAVRSARLHHAAGDLPGQGIVWAAGVPMMALCLGAATIFSGAAPTEPGGMVDLRALGRGPEARVVESPLVSLDSLLGSESNDLLFTVTSAQPHYWRLTALDDFDGRSWSASAKYVDLASGDTIESPWARGVTVNHQQIEVAIGDLATDWLPSVYAPRSVDAPIGMRYDRASGSVFVVDGDSTRSVDYRMDVDVASLERGDLQRAGGPIGKSLERFTTLPADFPQTVAREAADLTANLGPYDASLALERFFRSDRFRYDRTVNYRDQGDPLQAFLQDGRGFCQQFATAFAAMARSVGLPSRVAVGFTYGDPQTVLDPRTGATSTQWSVRGRFAHAWPEVYINGAGWVAFEPTPGRGNPDAETYTDAPAAQANESGGSVELSQATTTTTTIAGAAAGAVPTTLPDQAPRPAGERASGSTPAVETSHTPTIVMLVVAGLAFAAFIAVRLRVIVVRRRRTRDRRPEVSTAARVAASWQQACRDLARVGVQSDPAETPVEFARRAARLVEVEGLVTLGCRESDRRFRPGAPDEEEAASAEAISDEIRDVVWSRLDPRQRLAADLDLGVPSN